jgi:hypothetical protein
MRFGIINIPKYGELDHDTGSEPVRINCARLRHARFSIHLILTIFINYTRHR